MIITGPNFGRDRTLPFKRVADVQPQSPQTRAPIGRTPWRVVSDGKGMGAILDRDGNTLSTIVTIGIAHQIVNAVNGHSALLAECGVLADVLTATQMVLYAGTPEDAVKQARELIDGVMTP